MSRMTGLRAGSIGFSGSYRILSPVKIRKMPRIATTQPYCMRIELSETKSARDRIAPMIP